MLNLAHVVLRALKTEDTSLFKSFLSQQIAPFLFGNFGQHTDASCVILTRLLRENTTKGISLGEFSLKKLYSNNITIVYTYIVYGSGRAFNNYYRSQFERKTINCTS